MIGSETHFDSWTSSSPNVLSGVFERNAMQISFTSPFTELMKRAGANTTMFAFSHHSVLNVYASPRR